MARRCLPARHVSLPPGLPQRVGVGGVVLLLSGLVLGGFDQPTPYVLSFLGSAAAITTVSLLWEGAAERPGLTSGGSGRARAYRCVWW